jgi:serine/threonine-protein kinase RsbW
MDEDLRIKIEAPAELIMLKPLDLFVRGLAEQLPGFAGDEGSINGLELAFNEAFTNIHRHAYRCGPKGLVSIEIVAGLDSMEIRFEDDGESFDPDGVRVPDLDDPGEGGLGVWLIRKFMDEFIYYSDSRGRNVLRLIKRFPVRQRCGCEK